MKTKLTYSAVLLFISLGLFLGFKIGDDPTGNRSGNVADNSGYTPVYYPMGGTTVFSDDLDGDNTQVGLQSRGYKVINNSNPIGTTNWFQGNATAFPAFNGPTSGYVAANFNATTGGTGLIDDWLILPRIPGGIVANDTLSFWSRSSTVGTNYPDSIRVLYSANGDSTVNGSWVELGRFKVVNPSAGAPNNGYEKRSFTAAISGAIARFAIVYHVNNAGPSGSNSDYVGIDAIRINRPLATPPAPTTWFEQNSGVTTQLTSVSAPDINNVWICGYGGKVLRTTDGGTWTSASGNLSTADLYSIYAFDNNNALVTASPGGAFVYRTSNAGVTWTQVFTDANASAFIDSWYFKDPNNGLMIGDGYGGRSHIYKTTNAGLTWDSTGLNFNTTDGSYNNAIFGNGETVYWGTAGSKVYKTTNFGVNWTAQTTTGNTNTFSIWYNDTTKGFVGGTILQQTSNGGTTFVTNPGAGTGSYSGITGTTGGNFWFARGTGIYSTTNNGTNWVLAHSAAGTGVYNAMTKVRNGSPYLYAVTSTGGISKYGGTATGVTPISTVVENYVLSQNYPNPFNPTTKINFAIPSNGLVTLKIYDMTGKEVATLLNTQMNSGSYSVDFNAANLSSGMYFYTIRSGNFADTKKMMLIK